MMIFRSWKNIFHGRCCLALNLLHGSMKKNLTLRRIWSTWSGVQVPHPFVVLPYPPPSPLWLMPPSADRGLGAVPGWVVKIRSGSGSLPLSSRSLWSGKAPLLMLWQVLMVSILAMFSNSEITTGTGIKKG